MTKRYLSIFFLMFFVIAIIWLFIEGVKPEVFPIGSSMPEISYTDIYGTKILRPDNNNRTLIVYFSEKCPHCQFELNELNKNINKLENVKVYLFTSEKGYLVSKNIKKYDMLLISPNTTFGIISPKEYKNKFGGYVTPALYFFNEKGIFYAKKNGTTKYKSIKKEIIL